MTAQVIDLQPTELSINDTLMGAMKSRKNTHCVELVDDERTKEMWEVMDMYRFARNDAADIEDIVCYMREAFDWCEEHTLHQLCSFLSDDAIRVVPIKTSTKAAVG